MLAEMHWELTMFYRHSIIVLVLQIEKQIYRS